jgi:hypothetical protein
VKEVVSRALRFVIFLEIKVEDRVTQQIEQLAEVIQWLQQHIVYLEICQVPETPQDVRDQTEATARSVVERIKSLTMECKQLIDHSAQNYE